MPILPNPLARKDFWCLTTFFNPAHYKSRSRNHAIFVERLGNINLLVIELAFKDDVFELSNGPNVLRLRANSILWQKEKMLNYALNFLPDECKYVAWVDGDVLFSDDLWPNLAAEKFESGAGILQLFEEVRHLPPNCETYQGESILTERSLVWQARTYPDFISLRKQCKLLYATTGFAWAARRELLNHGFYDKHVLGANDNLIIDCCLGTFELHHYYRNGKDTLLLKDMMFWAERFGSHTADYIPQTICHLFHGSKKNRGYLTREDIVKKHNYDPNVDIKTENNVYEWNSEKPELHSEVENYFSSRLEDSTV